jgi:hypothetical protein
MDTGIGQIGGSTAAARRRHQGDYLPRIVPSGRVGAGETRRWKRGFSCGRRSGDGGPQVGGVQANRALNHGGTGVDAVNGVNGVNGVEGHDWGAAQD